MPSSAQPSTQPLPFEFKSGQFSLPRLLLRSNDMQAISEQLDIQVEKAPGFFQNAPVIIDLGELSAQSEVDFAWLVGLLRGNGMIPCGVKNASDHQKEMAELMELAILSDNNHKPSSKTQSNVKNRTAGNTEISSASSASKLITTPVRSGQRVYAARGDLIITSQVSSGAEVIADGNIHIYGTLRGRALAGVKGNKQARIFCHNLQADLVAIAGQYKLNESLTDSDMNKPVQIYLRENRLHIESI